MKNPPTRRLAPCVVTNEQHLYIIGGTPLVEALSTTERFDPIVDEWEEVAATNVERVASFGAAMDGKIYIAGGQRYGELVSSSEVYNPLTNEWQLMPNLRVPRWLASMVSYEGRLYILGGLTINRKRRKRVLAVEMFDFEMNEWKDKSVIPVRRFEPPNVKKELNLFQACFVRISKDVIDKVGPLNTTCM